MSSHLFPRPLEIYIQKKGKTPTSLYRRQEEEEECVKEFQESSLIQTVNFSFILRVLITISYFYFQTLNSCLVILIAPARVFDVIYSIF